MSVNQPQRLSYTRRDLLTYHDDVSKLIKHFIPRITDTSEINEGRLYLTLVEALVDNLNFSVDQMAVESYWELIRQRKNLLRMAYLIGYSPSPVSAASVDLLFSLISGVAGVGGYPIPIYSRCQTTVSPIYEFITMEAGLIPEGSSSVIVPAVQGIKTVGEILSSSSDGSQNQSYKLSNSKTPHIYIEVYVNGIVWDAVDDFADSGEEDTHYKLEFDEDDYTWIIFGDGEFGKIPPIGSQIKANYIRTLADQGNATKGIIAKIIGTIASDLTVTNGEGASGGAPSESNDSIKMNAPAHHRSFERDVTKFDYESTATKWSGVYKAFSNPSEGARTDIYLLPEGGGIASSLLISQVQNELDSRKMEGAIPVVHSLNLANITISVNVITKDSKSQKSTVKSKVRQETLDNLNYTKLTKGRGFTRSDLDGIYENIDNGKLIDYVDFSILSRVPRVQKSNIASPDFVGRVKISPTSGYDEYLVVALDTSTFMVSKNGIPQSTSGIVNVEFVSDNGEISFTLGESGDVLVAGDNWRFKTSSYVDNIVIDSDEYMSLEKDSDLVISVYYPGEYNIKTKSAL